jgi:hypothetical protein
VELEARETASRTRGDLTMQRNKVHHVYTVARVAKDLGADEDLIHELSLGLEPEDGVIWVNGLDDNDGTLAFIDEGVEEIQLLLEEHNRSTRSKAPRRGAQGIDSA